MALIVDQLVNKAADGDLHAIKEVIDRVEGRAQQSLNVTNENPFEDVDAATLRDAIQLIESLNDRPAGGVSKR